MAKALDMHTEQTEILARIVRAEERVQARLVRVTRLLGKAQIPYAVIGGHAVAAWVATKDESLVRATRDVDVLVKPEDLERIREVLEKDGFVYRHVAEMDIFLEDRDAKAGDGVHLIFEGRKVRPDHVLPAPQVDDSGIGELFSVIPLESLVRTKLVAWRRKDQVHLLDLLGAGVIDPSWPQRFQDPLRSRLQELIDNPE
ncbi:MAG: nucleotidyltransferase family protein [Fimbriimonas sp.]|nr:nucleotidyltransferase family protein [Fimbriimonas sp.]